MEAANDRYPGNISLETERGNVCKKCTVVFFVEVGADLENSQSVKAFVVFVRNHPQSLGHTCLPMLSLLPACARGTTPCI